MHEYVVANTYLDRTHERTHEAESEPDVPVFEYPAPDD
jgi:hypothetical protein